MSESSETLSDVVLWGSRTAIVGVVIAALSMTVSFAGIISVSPLYWAGILLGICGVAAAAIREAQHTGFRYAGGVLLAMVGVLVVGLGVDNESLPLVLLGVVILVVSVAGVVVDTQQQA